jgi:protein-S-isoprenylcysteine O-methyltransferase Ste14
VATAILAVPTWDSWRVGLLVAVIGEAIRIWAAGHLEKGREVTRSGPYRWTAHPLYVGSSVLALGVVIAAQSVVVLVLGLIYMVSTLTAAVRTEEAFLRGRFGDAYDEYQAL